MVILMRRRKSLRITSSSARGYGGKANDIPIDDAIALIGVALGGEYYDIAGSPIDDAIALIGVALMIGGAYYLITRIERGIILSNRKKTYVIFSIVIGFLMMLAGYYHFVAIYVARLLA
jgi:hypothetical protein